MVRPLSAPDPLVAVRKLPLFAGTEVTITPLPGGLTNTNVRVRSANRDVVVRISPPGSGLLTIDREIEYVNTLRAAAAGAGPGVAGYVAGEGILAVEFISSITYDDAAVGMNADRVAAAVRRLHAGESFVNRFDIFAVQDRYLQLIAEQGWRIPQGYESDLVPGRQLRRALAVGPEPLRPCHNDLLAANFLDDGDRVWIIDYEYSGNNEPAFELGNIAQEAHLPEDGLVALTEHYYGRHDPRLIARAKLWAVASAFVWTLWGVISAHTNTLDFDFLDWGMEKYARARMAFRDSGFPDLLDAVGRPV